MIGFLRKTRAGICPVVERSLKIVKLDVKLIGKKCKYDLKL
jgi:hypothetical protein